MPSYLSYIEREHENEHREHEKELTLNIFVKAGYPRRFVDSVINQFENKVEKLIPDFLFEDRK